MSALVVDAVVREGRIHTKRCFKCGADKLRTEFYQHLCHVVADAERRNSQ